MKLTITNDVNELVTKLTKELDTARLERNDACLALRVMTARLEEMEAARDAAQRLAVRNADRMKEVLENKPKINRWQLDNYASTC